MKKNFKATLSAVLALSVGVGSTIGFAGCFGGEEDLVTITGSSSMFELMCDLAAAYEEKIGEVDVIRVTSSDSGTGISDAQNGKNDFGMASRNLKSSETGVEQKAICNDGVALIVNTQSLVTSVSMEEVFGLYYNHTAIQNSLTTAISREASSGTRGAFDDIIKGEVDGVTKALKDVGVYSDIIIKNSTGDVKSSIVANQNANQVGYISMGSLDSSVKALRFAGVEATPENVKNDTYKLYRPFNIVYKSYEGLSDAAKAFINFIESEEGQAIIAQGKYITLG